MIWGVGSRVRKLVVVVAVLATACGGTVTPAASPAASPTAAATASRAAFNNVTIKWAGATLDYGALLEIAAKEILAPQGINLDIAFGLDPATVTQLMVQDQAKGGWAAVVSFLPAIQKAAPITIVQSGVRNTFSYAAAPSITSVTQLNGKRVAVHSPVSFTKTVTDALIRKHGITGTTELIIQGSDVRLQALLDGKIDATTVDLADIVRLRATVGESAVRLLGTVSAEFPELLYTVVAMRSDFTKSQPQVAAAITKAFAEGADRMNKDGAYALSLAEKHLPQEKPEVRKAIIEAFRQAGVWNASDLTPASATSTLKFLYDYKSIDIDPATIKLENYFDFTVYRR